jgi:hypothetical protein
VIDRLTRWIPQAERGFDLLVSAQPFPNFDVKLDWRREEYGGNWYFRPEDNLDCWFCPALFKYFPEAPVCLYGLANVKS